MYDSFLPGPSKGVQWRSPSSVGASIGDPFEGAGIYTVYIIVAGHQLVK